MLDSFVGPSLIALAALLWGTDALFRVPTSEKLDPTFIVFCEHVVGLLVLLPFVWLRHRGDLFKLGWKQWLSAVFVGAGGSAIATVLFTASFRYLNPSVVILLQKLQPVLVVLLAYAILREKPSPRFYGWAVVALGAAVVLSFPTLDFRFLFEKGNLQTLGMGYALGACAIWGAATIAGRILLSGTAPLLATFWRYVFGLAMLASLLGAGGVAAGPSQVTAWPIASALLYLSVVSGVIPMFAYYAGLARTPANVTTFVELLYPVSAIALNWAILHAALGTTQLVAGALLLIAVTAIAKR